MSAGLDIVHARVAFRHRGFLDVLDLALRFIVVHAKAYAKVALVTLPPGVVLATLIASDSGWGWGWTVAIVWALLAQVPFTLLASRLVFEDNVRVRDVLVTALKRSVRVLILRILTLFTICLGGLVFFAPAVWVAMIFCFSTEVLLLEGASIGQSFGRAQRVANSDLSESFLMLFLGSLLIGAAVLIGEYGGHAIISDLLQFRAPRSMWSEGGSVLALIGLIGFMPYLATARFFSYLNIRTRTEGWDIQTRFAAIAAREAADAEQEGKGRVRDAA